MKKSFSLLGKIVFFIFSFGLIFYLVRPLLQADVAVIASGVGPILSWGIIGLVAFMTPFAVAVRRNLDLFGFGVNFADAYLAFFLSQIGKYIPGKIFLVLIRSAIYADLGIPIRVGAVSLGIEIPLYVAGALIAGCGMFLSGGGSFEQNWQWVIGLVCTGMIVLLIPVTLGYVDRLILKKDGVLLFGGRVNHRGLWKLILIYMVTWVGIGVVFGVMATRLFELDITRVPLIGSVFVFSCVAGYVVPFAPAGLGARELVITGLLTPVMGAGNAAALAVIARIWWTAGEGICVILAAIIVIRTNRWGRIREIFQNRDQSRKLEIK